MPIIDNGILFHHFEEVDPKPGMRLGRHQQLDARSLAFTIGPEEARRIRPAEWVPPIPNLDQGNLGSCTGNASTYHLAELYGVDDFDKVLLANLTLSATDTEANQRFAVELYSQASGRDPWPGTYPPEDTGSSGLACAQVLRSSQLIKRYRWALSARGFAALLQRRGAITGWPWFDAWFSPDNNGFVDAGNWGASGVSGGHEVYCEALETWEENDSDRSVLRFRNSWGDSWGDHGCFRMRLGTYNHLRSYVDVQQFEQPDV